MTAKAPRPMPKRKDGVNISETPEGGIRRPELAPSAPPPPPAWARRR